MKDGNLVMANVLEMEMPTKVCSKCQIEKDIIDFYPTPYSACGYKAVCKQCQSEYGKKYRDELCAMNEASIAFHGQQVKAVKSGRKMSHGTYGTGAAAYKIKKLGVCLIGKHSHHWNYNKDLDVILLGKNEHRFVHRFMVFDVNSKTYRVNGTNILLDTKEKHIEFIETILDFFKMEKSMMLFDFTDYRKYSNNKLKNSNVTKTKNA